MKKSVLVLGLLLSFLLGSCQGIFTPTPGPTVDSAGTSDALFKTAVAQTLTARPSATSTSATETATLAPASPVVPATDTLTATQGVTTPVDLTVTPVPGASQTPSATIAAASQTPTATLAVATAQITAIWTLAIRTYGTLPPAVPFSYVTLINRARTEAYISLQVTMPDGTYSILEYPVEGTVKIKAPVGSYLYVAWVGGRKMVGEFRLTHGDDLSITLQRDRIVIK